MSNLPDIQTREDIQQIVSGFYEAVKQDDLIGWIFTDAFAVDWEAHIPLMVDFWESVLFGTAIYRGNPVHKHVAVDRQVPLQDAHFERWLTIFHQTVDSRFAGEKAVDIKTRASVMRVLIWTKILQGREKGNIL